MLRGLRPLGGDPSSDETWLTQTVDFIPPSPLVNAALNQAHDWVLWKGVDGRVKLGLGAASRAVHSNFQTATECYRQSSEGPPFVFFGGRFDDGRPDTTSPWSDWGCVETYTPLLVIEWADLESHQALITLKLDQIDSTVDSVTRLLEVRRPLNEPATQIQWRPAESEDAWCDRVRHLQDSFQPNGLEKVVMARQVDSTKAIATNQIIHAVRHLLTHSADETVFIFGRPSGIFMGSSPETLVNLASGSLQTHALAGTSTDGQDTALLQRDEKIRREHEAVIRHLETKLTTIATELTVHETQLRHSRALLHLETKVQATVVDKHLLDLVDHLHPTPALGGAPAEAANQWLRENESLDRGWFGGPIGWFSREGDGQCAVAIRCALILASTAHAYAGAGIVRGSDPSKEWRETQAKLASILDAFKEHAS